MFSDHEFFSSFWSPSPSTILSPADLLAAFLEGGGAETGDMLFEGPLLFVESEIDWPGFWDDSSAERLCMALALAAASLAADAHSLKVLLLGSSQYLFQKPERPPQT